MDSTTGNGRTAVGGLLVFHAKRPSQDPKCTPRKAEINV